VGVMNPAKNIIEHHVYYISYIDDPHT
jgi:hypothetical protein